MRTIAACLAVALSISSPALADDRFGSQGQVAPYGSVSISYAASTASGQSGTTNFDAGLGVLYFVSKDIAIGGQLSSSYTSMPSTSSKQVGAAPVIATNLWLGERVSFFPRLALILAYESQRIGPIGTEEGSIIFQDSSFVVRPVLDLPILFHPTPHFFVGLGPFLYVSLYTNGNSTDYELGASTTIGGYF